MDLIWAASALFLTLFLRSSFGRLLKDHGAVKPNYNGQTVTFPWGVLLVLVVSVIYSLRLLVEGSDLLLGQSLLVCYGAGFLGLVDDLLGDAGCRGLRGHIRAFWEERKLTSGLIKAAGGLLLSLILGSRAARLHDLLLLGLNLALAMNALNLLDVRPGRAGKGFLLFWLLLYLVGSKEAALKAGLPLGFALAAYLPLDLREQAMLGDTGANLLGAVLGLIIGHDLSWTGALLALAILIGLHVLTAFYSLSSLIARVPPLAVLDWAGRPKK